MFTPGTEVAGVFPEELQGIDDLSGAVYVELVGGKALDDLAKG
jgi:hypothetical protein